jgi:hypothetical protein
MYKLGFQELAILNFEGFIMFQQTMQLPPSGLVSLGWFLKPLYRSGIRQCVGDEGAIGQNTVIGTIH